MDSIQDRRSIRKYKSLPVDKEDIDQVIEAAILAPSAKNRQPWKYLVYTEAGKDAILDEMEKGLLREKMVRLFCLNQEVAFLMRFIR